MTFAIIFFVAVLVGATKNRYGLQLPKVVFLIVREVLMIELLALKVSQGVFVVPKHSRVCNFLSE